ncbi:cytochrome P450 [Atractiella rhizophila]|nr:cytochrome P450 [Atractiella rhizophila]
MDVAQNFLHERSALLVKLLAVPVTLYLFLRVFVALRWRLASLRTLPGPPSSSLIWGNLKEILAESPGAPHLRWGKQYGKVLRYHGMLGDSRLLVMDPVSLHHILTSKGYEYPKPNEMRGDLKRMFGDGILFAEGDDHRRQRKIMNPAFSAGHLKQLVPTFFDKTMKLRDQWFDLLAAGKHDDAQPFPKGMEAEGEVEKDGVVIDILKSLNKVTLNIIGVTGFGYEFDALENDDSPLYHAFRTMFPMTRPASPSRFMLFIMVLRMYAPFLLRMFPTEVGRQMNAATESLKMQGMKLIEERKEEVLQEKGGRDLISLLIRANVEAKKKGDKKAFITDAELLGQVMTFLLAGHETTSTTATFMLHYLSLHPAVQSKLRAEILASRASITPDSDPEILNALPYLDACCREVLRLRSPVSTTFRSAAHDDVVPMSDGSSFRITKGRQIVIGIDGFNRAERVWGNDAEVFRPERWLEGEAGKSDGVTTGVFAGLLTFLEGPRSCIGYRFAIWELKAIIFNLIAEFEFSPRSKDTEVEARSMLVTRPRIVGEPELGTRLPLRVRKYVG